MTLPIGLTVKELGITWGLASRLVICLRMTPNCFSSYSVVTMWRSSAITVQRRPPIGLL